MSTIPSADAKAVVRAAEALTTQVRRIADALHTPVVEYEVAEADAPTTPATTCSAQHRGFDDGRLCIRAAHHHGDHIDERGFHWSDTVAVYPVDSTVRITHWHPMSEQLAGERQELAGMMEAFIDAQMPQAPAADEDAQRTARRESLRHLTDRAARGVLVSPGEGALLREHVEAEIREADQLRAGRATWKTKAEEIEQDRDRIAEDRDTADRIRAEVQRDRDQHAAVLNEVLATFVHKVPGYRIPRVRSGEVDVVTLDKWRSVVAPTVERPWWVTVAEVRAELEEAQAAIERVRAYLASQTAPFPKGYVVAVAAADVLAALDGTEQPTTEEQR